MHPKTKMTMYVHFRCHQCLLTEYCVAKMNVFYSAEHFIGLATGQLALPSTTHSLVEDHPHSVSLEPALGGRGYVAHIGGLL
jgi:hypothetical protein